MRKSKTSIYSLIYLTIAVNIIIPKAGIKVGAIPLTVGNALLAVSFLLYLRKTHGKIKSDSIGKLILFQMLFWIIRFVIIGNLSLGTYLGMIIPLVVYPITYFLTRFYLKKAGTDKIERVIKTGMLVIIVYSFVQLLFGIGRVAIPGITVNLTDYMNNPSSWWMEKFNMFGTSSKIVSTYQNGNVLGCSMLLLFPIAFRVNYKKEIYRYGMLISFLLAVFLTGSRACLLGAFFYLFLLVVRLFKDKHFSINKMLIVGATICVGAGIIYKVVSSRLNTDLLARLLGTLNGDVFLKGAGRTDNALRYCKWSLDHLWSVLVGGLGANYEGGGYEMTYVAVFVLGGIIGLILFLTPFIRVQKEVIIAFKKTGNRIVLGAFEGLTVYLVTAFIEGAFWLPPAAINLWFVCALGMHLAGEIKNENYIFDS